MASRYDEYVNVKDFSDKISRALSAAKKDNDFIYHDRVPDLKDLDPIGKATLVKSTPVSVPISQKFTGMSSIQIHFNVTHLSPSLICFFKLKSYNCYCMLWIWFAFMFKMNMRIKMKWCIYSEISRGRVNGNKVSVYNREFETE